MGKPCRCHHAKSRHEAWGTKRPGKCLVPGCPCRGYVEAAKQRVIEGDW